MDNTISFVGYCPDGTFKRALKHRENPLELETFYDAVNQDTASGCCSCCKQDRGIIFAVQPVGLPIKPSVLSLCVACISKLPVALTVINLDSHGSPPLLIDKKYESEV